MDLAQQLMLEQFQKEEEANERARQLREQLLKAEVENMSPLANVEVAPLAGAIDSAFGTRVAPGIQAAEAKREPMRKRADDLLDGLMKDADGGSLKGMGSGQAGNSRGATQAGYQQFSAYKTLDDKFDKQYKEVAEARQKLDALDNAFNAGNIEQIRAALSTYASFVQGNKGVLSDSDLSRQMVDTLQNRLAAFSAFFGDKNYKLPPEEIANLVNATQEARRGIATKFSEAADAAADTYGSGHPAFAAAFQQHTRVPGNKFELIRKAAGDIGVSKYRSGKKSAAPSVAGASGGAAPLSLEAIKAERAKRKGG